MTVMPGPRPLVHVVGARPNFVKAAPVIRALAAAGVAQRVVHTGQHYDEALSEVFFAELGPAGAGPQPRRRLGDPRRARPRPSWSPSRRRSSPSARRSSSSTATSTRRSPPRSSLPSSDVPQAHVEAGLRSFDMSMPEEVNRRVTDALADLCFATSAEAVDNLRREGVPAERIHLVGNSMIDSLRGGPAAPRSGRSPGGGRPPGRPVRRGHAPPARRTSTSRGAPGPSSTGWPRRPPRCRSCSRSIPADGPRSRRPGSPTSRGLHLVEPLGYLAFLSLVARRAPSWSPTRAASRRRRRSSAFPCLTVRPNTERPVTITHGTNRLIEPGELAAAVAVVAAATALAAGPAALGEPASGRRSGTAGPASGSRQSSLTGSGTAPRRARRDGANGPPGDAPPPPRRDAGPQLLRGGPARPPPGRDPRARRAARSTSSRCAVPATRPRGCWRGSGSPASTCSATRDRRSRRTSPSTRPSWCAPHSSWPAPTAAAATRWSRSTRRPTSSSSRRCPSAWPGVPLLLDLHEATPEFFRSRWPGASNPLTIGALTAVERVSTAIADRVLSVNQARHERHVALGIPERKLARGPQRTGAGPLRPRRPPETRVHGRRHAPPGLRGRPDPALRSRRTSSMRSRSWPSGAPSSRWSSTSTGGATRRTSSARAPTSAGSPTGCVFHGRIALDAVAASLAGCDIALSPIRRNRFSEISLSTKVFEGAIMGKPVVAADLPAARAEFEADMLAWYAPDDPADLARAILRVVDDPAWRAAVADRAAARARELGLGRRGAALRRHRRGARPRPGILLTETRGSRQGGVVEQDRSIAVIGLGYVGLPLALGFTEAGARGHGHRRQRAARRGAQRRPLADRGHQRRAPGRRPRGRASGPWRPIPRCVRAADAVFVCVPDAGHGHQDPDLGPVLARRPSSSAPASAPGTSSFSSRPPSRARRPAPSGRSSSATPGLRAGDDFDLAFAPERVNPGDPGELGQAGAAPRRRLHAGGHDARRRAAAQHQRHGRRALVARRGRDGEAARERLPEHQHRVRQPAGAPVRADGPRRLGGHRRGRHQAVRVHEVHARAGRRRALHPGRPVLPLLAGPRVRLHRPLHRARRRRQRRHAAPRGGPGGRGPQRPLARAEAAPGSACSAWPSSRTSRDARESPAADVLALLRERGADVRFHDPHVARFRDASGPDRRRRRRSTTSSAGPTSSSS